GLPLVLVVSAVVVRDRRALLTRRGPAAHLAGYWELPGGKIEPGEGPRAALARALAEELGVGCRVGEAFGFNDHEYADRRVLLLAYRVEIDGRPRPLRCTAVGWFPAHRIGALRTPPADTPILQRLIRLLRERGEAPRPPGAA
ncbi:MAG: NUDIX domain-containing protein, partial [Planctomycetota bacterium]